MSLNNKFKTSSNGLDIIKYYESFKAKKYICPAGKPTIGYGHVILSNEAYLYTKVLTKDEANSLLMSDLVSRELTVINNVKVQLTQNEFDALVSFIFNVGDANFKSSTMLKLINANDKTAAAKEFIKWNKSRVNGILTALEGLTKRRATESKLFLTGKVEL